MSVNELAAYVHFLNRLFQPVLFWVEEFKINLHQAHLLSLSLGRASKVLLGFYFGALSFYFYRLYLSRCLYL